MPLFTYKFYHEFMAKSRERDDIATTNGWEERLHIEYRLVLMKITHAVLAWVKFYLITLSINDPKASLSPI